VHIAGCPGCAQELADAQRGAAWLGLLKSQAPEPPADLLGNILARTVGQQGLVAELAPVPLPSSGYLPAGAPEPRQAGFRGKLGRWLGLDTAFVPALQPRLTMTAAMAFCSVCLTLNLLGISVHSLQAESFRPAGLQRAVADKGATLVRSFEGIRTVYRVESRVNEFLSASSGQGEAPLGSNR
jgi:hypothetical protein